MSKKRVLLGMSGGTDSSVSAILLQEQGYEVTGVTFRFFESENETHIDDAASLAQKLRIDHFVFEAKEIFKSQIIDYFVSEYLTGRTPVPCVLCNNYLKWPLLIQLADERGIDFVATGHYVRKVEFDGLSYISTGVDPDKDQSFFLWGLPQEIIRRMVLPLGEMMKSEVRQFAASRGFEKVSKKKDSLGVCFCPGDYRSFLKKYIDKNSQFEGNFVDSLGGFLGKHVGFPFYTIGQRRGLGIHLNRAIYVKEISVETNDVVLAGIDELYKTEVYLKDVRFVCEDDFNGEVICKVRYRKQSARAKIQFLSKDRVLVMFIDAEHSLAPGQSAVFYKGDRVIGGGIIES